MTLVQASQPQAAPLQMTPLQMTQPRVLQPGMEVQWTLNTSDGQPGSVLEGKAQIGPDGTIMVGPYGVCKVGGLTMNQAAMAVDRQVRGFVRNPNVQISAMAPATVAPATAATVSSAPVSAPEMGGGQVVDLAWRASGTASQPAMAQVGSSSAEIVAPTTRSTKTGTYQVVSPGNRRVVQNQTVLADDGVVPEPTFGQRMRQFFGLTPTPVQNSNPNVVYVMQGDSMKR